MWVFRRKVFVCEYKRCLPFNISMVLVIILRADVLCGQCTGYSAMQGTQIPTWFQAVIANPVVSSHSDKRADPSWKIKIATLTIGNLGIASWSWAESGVVRPHSILWRPGQSWILLCGVGIRPRSLVSRERTRRLSRCAKGNCDMMRREIVWMMSQVQMPASSWCTADLLPLSSGEYQPPALQMPFLWRGYLLNLTFCENKINMSVLL